MTDKMREGFEAWAKNEHALTETAWKAWQAATLAERERNARLCEENQVASSTHGPTKLAKWDGSFGGRHEGMTYAAAIRQGGDA